jgi:hypothetical protein
MLCEQHVVVLVRLEGRIEVHEIDSLVLDMCAQDVEVVSVIEGVQVAHAQGSRVDLQAASPKARTPASITERLEVRISTSSLPNPDTLPFAKSRIEDRFLRLPG